MGFGVIGSLVAIIAVVILLLSIKLLASSSWIMGFARGLAGFIALFVAAVLGFAAQDLFVFRALKPDQTVMTVSFRRTSPHHYSVEIQETAGTVSTANIQGDTWQLDARMFHWVPLFKAVGFRTGYQLQSVKGGADDQGTVLREASNMVDVWSFINSHAGVVPGINAVLVSPGLLPVADAAIFDVQLAGTQLVAVPLNDTAKNAGKVNAAGEEEESVLLQEISLTPDGNGSEAVVEGAAAAKESTPVEESAVAKDAVKDEKPVPAKSPAP